MSAPAHVALPPDFLRRLAHELRAPTALVIHLRESVQSELGARMSDELRKATFLVDGAVRRFERLAARLDLMAELQSDASDTMMHLTDFVAIVAQGVELCQQLERRRDVVVTSELTNARCVIRGDSERLAFVVTELVHNAIRHGRRRVRVRLEQRGAEALLTVEDDGKGVAQDRRASLLERSLPPVGRSGLGIGLAIVSEVVRAHGGRVELGDSTFPGFDPGTLGARFLVTLAAEA